MDGVNGSFPALFREEDELVEKEIRDRFKKMCEGYFDSVCKKLVIEHNVSLTIRSIDLINRLCAALARARPKEPRSIYSFRRDLRGPPTGLREDDERLREAAC